MANGGRGRWIGGLCVGLAALCVGCSGGQKASPAGPGQSARGAAGQAEKPASGQPQNKQQTADDSQPAAGEAPVPAPAAPPSHVSLPRRAQFSVSTLFVLCLAWTSAVCHPCFPPNG